MYNLAKIKKIISDNFQEKYTSLTNHIGSSAPLSSDKNLKNSSKNIRETFHVECFLKINLIKVLNVCHLSNLTF